MIYMLCDMCPLFTYLAPLTVIHTFWLIPPPIHNITKSWGTMEFSIHSLYREANFLQSLFLINICIKLLVSILVTSVPLPYLPHEAKISHTSVATHNVLRVHSNFRCCYSSLNNRCMEK